MKRIPSKYFELAEPIMKANPTSILLRARNIESGSNPSAERITLNIIV
jgi:hypothetical protein